MLVRALLVAVCLAVPVIVAPEAQAATTLITNCNQTVTTNAVLTQNLHCAGVGIDVGADHITIDLKGFRLRGDRNSSLNGIDDSAGFDHVTIKNGVIRNFGIGIDADAQADGVVIEDVVASGNSSQGIYVAGNGAVVKSSSAVGNSSVGVIVNGVKSSIKSVDASGNSAGIEVDGASPTIASVTASGNVSDGIFAFGSGASVKSSVASGNGGAGIHVIGDAAQLKGNQADGNGFSGGASDLNGFGILVELYTAPPSGANGALGNDNTADCSPALLC